MQSLSQEKIDRLSVPSELFKVLLKVEYLYLPRRRNCEGEVGVEIRFRMLEKSKMGSKQGIVTVNL